MQTQRRVREVDYKKANKQWHCNSLSLTMSLLKKSMNLAWSHAPSNIRRAMIPLHEIATRAVSLCPLTKMLLHLERCPRRTHAHGRFRHLLFWKSRHVENASLYSCIQLHCHYTMMFWFAFGEFCVQMWCVFLPWLTRCGTSKFERKSTDVWCIGYVGWDVGHVCKR